MRCSNAFAHLSVCLFFVCLTVCSAITFESLDLESLFFGMWTETVTVFSILRQSINQSIFVYYGMTKSRPTE